MKRLVALSMTLFLILAACGGGGDDSSETGGPGAEEFAESCGVRPACPIVASSTAEIVPDMNRLLVGLINDDDAPIASPKIDMHIDFFKLDESTTEPKFERDMDFVWTVQNVVGLYVTEPEFDSPGVWGAEITVEGDGVNETIKQRIVVSPESPTPAIGEEVPSAKTPTKDDVKDLAEISTDPKPDPAFYELSIDEALEKHEPFVVAFATPKFCQTQFCGPTLDKVKKVAKDFPNVNFIHSEIYQNLEPENPVVSAVTDWGLPSEPWVFVVDADGKLVQKYEVAFSPDELAAELEKL
jgi:hypothetical protein